MSFILDALKKLEQKRQRGSVPDIMTVHIPEKAETRKQPILLYVVSAVLVLNAVVIVSWLLSGEKEKSTALIVSSADPHNMKNVSSSDVKSSDSIKSDQKPNSTAGGAEISQDKTSIPPAPSKEKHLTQPYDSKKQNMQGRVQETKKYSADVPHEPHPVSPAPVPKMPENNVAKPPHGIYELSQLPQDIQNQIPNMTIQGHIYSDSASTRMVNINGSIFREGDMAAKDIKIENITENGVVFDYNGWRFSIRAF